MGTRKKSGTKINGIIVNIFQYCHCCGLIIVIRYYIWIKVWSGLKKKVTVLMSLKLDTWLIQPCVLINPSKNNWKNVWTIHLVYSYNLLLFWNNYKNNTRFLGLLMLHETRAKKPKKYFIVLRCVIYTIINNYVFIDYLACQSQKKKWNFCGF